MVVALVTRLCAKAYGIIILFGTQESAILKAGDYAGGRKCGTGPDNERCDMSQSASSVIRDMKARVPLGRAFPVTYRHGMCMFLWHFFYVPDNEGYEFVSRED